MRLRRSLDLHLTAMVPHRAWFGHVDGRAWHDITTSGRRLARLVSVPTASPSSCPDSCAQLAYLRHSFTSSHSLLLVSPFPQRSAFNTFIFFPCPNARLVCFLTFSLPRSKRFFFSQCFLVPLSLFLFCPWHWSSLPIPSPHFRILVISMMREALVRSGGPQTRLGCGRR